MGPLGSATPAQVSTATQESSAEPSFFTPAADQSIPIDPASGDEAVCGGESPADLPTETTIEASGGAIDANEDAAACADELATIIDGGVAAEDTCKATAEEDNVAEAAPYEENPTEEAVIDKEVLEAMLQAQLQKKIEEAIENDQIKQEKTSAAKATKKADTNKKDLEQVPEGFKKIGTINVGDRFAGLNSSSTKSAAKGDIRPEASIRIIVPKIEEPKTESEAAKPVISTVESKTSWRTPSRINYGESIPIRNLRPITESPMDPNFGPDLVPGGRAYSITSSRHIPVAHRFEPNESQSMGSIGINRTFLFSVYDVHNTLADKPSVLQVIDKDGNVVREIILTAGAHSQYEIELAEGEYTVVAKSGQVAAASDGKKDQYDNFRVDVLEKQSAGKSEAPAVEATSGSPSADNGSTTT